MTNAIGMAVIGAGYWGPNLVRNAMATSSIDVRWLCDLDEERARTVLGRYSTIRTTDSFDAVLDDPTVQAVAIATPAASHFPLAMAALDAGKHVLVEKPLTAAYSDGQKLVQAAEDRGLVLMCDHTYCYTSAVQGAATPRAERRARRHPVHRLRADQPRPGAARRQRALGPGPARPVDPGLPPPPGRDRRGGGRPGCRPDRRTAWSASATSRSGCRAAPSPTCTSTGSARSRSAPWSSADRTARWCGTT